VRDVSASECRSQLDSVWRSVDDLSEQVKKINGKSAAEKQGADEILVARTKMMIDTTVQDSREDMMRVIESRITSATAEIDGCATKSELNELRTRLELKLQEVDRKETHRHSVVKFDPAAGQPEHGSSTSTGMRVKKLSERLDDSEKQLLVVAEAVRDVHEELVEKLERVETQSKALDALQRSLQETFDRDQAVVQEQTAALRTQLMSVMEELEKTRPAGGDGIATATETPPSQTPVDGAAAEATPKPASPPHEGHTAAGAGSPQSVAFSHRALEEQLHSLRKDHSMLQHELRRDVAELKSQQDQIFDRHVGLQKAQRDDVNALKSDIGAVSARAQQNAEQLSDRLHEMTEASNENSAKHHDSVGGGRPAPQAEGALAPASSNEITHLRGRVDKLESASAHLSARLDDAVETLKRDDDTIRARLDRVEAAQAAAPHASSPPLTAHPPSTPKATTPKPSTPKPSTPKADSRPSTSAAQPPPAADDPPVDSANTTQGAPFAGDGPTTTDGMPPPNTASSTA
jgi:chromosome segregation ATPase